jgi:hypothetical protein
MLNSLILNIETIIFIPFHPTDTYDGRDAETGSEGGLSHHRARRRTTGTLSWGVGMPEIASLDGDGGWTGSAHRTGVGEPTE